MMMATEPTPEEASDALREISGRRRQAATGRNSEPKWVLWAAAALVLALGLVSDLSPQLQTPMSYLILVFVLLVSYLPRWKRFGSAIGYRRSPGIHRGSMPRRTRLLNVLVLLVMIVLVLAGSALLRDSEVPYPGTIVSLLIVAALPLWQRFFGHRMGAPRADHG